MYSNYKICDALQPKEKCFRVQELKDGHYCEVFHEHIPSYRMSTDSAVNALNALTIHYSRLAPSTVLRSYLNKRGKEPAAAPLITIVTEYPEPGVLRRYSSAHSVNAWLDEVVSGEKFRVPRTSTT